MPTRASRGNPNVHSEFHLIQQVKQLLGSAGTSVVVGIGDDAALIELNPKHQTLLSTDLLIEHIHFDLTYSTLVDVGYKAAVANLSDIAAMGGIPRYMLVGLALPPVLRRTTPVKQLYKGIRQACQHLKVAIIGGDTSASRQDLFLSITIIGENPKGLCLTRAGAKVGDLLYVTGTLGDSHCGLKILQQHKAKTSRSSPHSSKRPYQFLIARHLRPTARVDIGRLLSAGRIATAAIDLSDGLSGDLHHLCQQSRVGAEIEETHLPLSRACRTYATAQQSNPSTYALAGGEDYELLFTVPPKNQKKLDKIVHALNYPITKIGSIRSKNFGVRLTSYNGKQKRLTRVSYQHFTNRTPGSFYRHA